MVVRKINSTFSLSIFTSSHRSPTKFEVHVRHIFIFSAESKAEAVVSKRANDCKLCVLHGAQPPSHMISAPYRCLRQGILLENVLVRSWHTENEVAWHPKRAEFFGTQCHLGLGPNFMVLLTVSKESELAEAGLAQKCCCCLHLRGENGDQAMDETSAHVLLEN